jgi:hypothetical protein
LPDNAYTLFEVQFLHLVNQHLFPIPEYVFDDPCEENRYYGVPIEPYGLGSIYEYGSVGDAVVDMDLGWQLLFYLEGELSEETEPLSFLFLAIAMLDHNTGTVWLDATSDMPVDDARWERDVVEELARQFVESEEIWKKANQFVDWLEDDIFSHFTEVIHLWNRCITTR